MNMRKIIVISMVTLLALCVLPQLSGISHAGPKGVGGSLHDMSVWYQHADYPPAGFLGSTSTHGYKYLTFQVCVFCHTPHGANPDMREDTYWDENTKAYEQGNVAGADTPYLLWNRAVSDPGVNEFRLYSSGTMEAGNNTTQVWPYSLMCLSCHDGISAVNVLYSNPGDYPFAGAIEPEGGWGSDTQLGSFAGNPANIGDRLASGDSGVTDLSNDHPISIDYTTSQATDTGLLAADPSGYVSDPKIRLFAKPTDATRSNKVSVECPTCHDVHNEGRKAGDATVDQYSNKFPFLAVSAKGSYLCLQCHNK